MSMSSHPADPGKINLLLAIMHMLRKSLKKSKMVRDIFISYDLCVRFYLFMKTSLALHNSSRNAFFAIFVSSMS